MVADQILTTRGDCVAVVGSESMSMSRVLPFSFGNKSRFDVFFLAHWDISSPKDFFSFFLTDFMMPFSRVLVRSL